MRSLQRLSILNLDVRSGISVDGRLNIGGGVEHGLSFWGGAHDVTSILNLGVVSKARVTRGTMVGAVGASFPSVVVLAGRCLSSSAS